MLFMVVVVHDMDVDEKKYMEFMVVFVYYIGINEEEGVHIAVVEFARYMNNKDD